MNNNKLPCEVLINVFRQLLKGQYDIPQIKYKILPLVCRRWYQATLLLEPRAIECNRPINNQFDELLKDFERYPEFAPSIRRLVLTDSSWRGSERPLPHQISESTKITSVIKQCTSLQCLEIATTHCWSVALNILQQLERYKYDFEKLEAYLCLAKSNNPMCLAFNRFLDSHGSKLRFVDLDEMEIDEFKHRSKERVHSARAIHFYYDCNYEAEPLALKELQVRCGGITMSRACIEYIFSGAFSQLESLNLCITVAQDVMVNSTELFDKIRDCCENSTMKDYNIVFSRECDGQLFYSLDTRWRFPYEDRYNPIPRTFSR